MNRAMPCRTSSLPVAAGWGSLALLLLAVPASPQAFEIALARPSCEAAVAEVETLLAKPGLDRIGAPYGGVLRQCPSTSHPDVAYCLGRRIALAHAEAATALAGDASGERALGLVKTGLGYASPWQLLAARGELEEAERRHAGAALAFSLAIDDYAENPVCRDEQAIIDEMGREEQRRVAERLYRDAEYNTLAARRLPDRVVYRCCTRSGLRRSEIRGFVPERQIFRVDFVPRRILLAGDGLEGLDRLVKYVRRLGATELSLSLHTERMRSARRACAVAKARLVLVERAILRQLPQVRLRGIAVGQALPYERMREGTLAARHDFARVAVLGPQAAPDGGCP
jgi:hypothetical protein